MNKVIQGNNIDILKTYPDNTFDSIVTDPPYGIEFLGKDWDNNTGAVETWAECFRVLKPGGYILAFSAARTYHNLATNIEGVGFEIRDQIMWLYASGFPKAQDMGKAIDKRAGKGKGQTVKADYNNNRDGVSVDLTINGVRCPVCKKDSANRYHCGKGQECGMVYKAQTPEAQQWAGWKTALKPAHEPIVMARKPFRGSCVDNVLTHGVGAVNIDVSRIAYQDEGDLEQTKGWSNKAKGKATHKYFDGKTDNTKTDYDKVDTFTTQGRFPSNVLGEVEDYQKFFYCPKVSRAERHIGFESAPKLGQILKDMGAYFVNNEGNRIEYKDRQDVGMVYVPHVGSIMPYRHVYDEYRQWSIDKDLKPKLDHIPTNPKGMLQDRYDSGMQTGMYQDAKEKQSATTSGNNHPTVKPVALMKYLIKLVTPAGGSVLDPFTGSGSTGMAAVELGYDFTGCELDPDYVDIATKRITAWGNKTDLNNNALPEEWFTED